MSVLNVNFVTNLVINSTTYATRLQVQDIICYLSHVQMNLGSVALVIVHTDVTIFTALSGWSPQYQYR